MINEISLFISVLLQCTFCFAYLIRTAYQKIRYVVRRVKPNLVVLLYRFIIRIIYSWDGLVN